MRARIVVGIILAFVPWPLGRCSNGNEGARSRRYVSYSPPIVYPYGGTFKLIVGFAVPVQISGKILVYGQNFQFQYALPQNATLFTDFFEGTGTSGRRRRNVSRKDKALVYRILEDQLERNNLNGRECLRKSICEVASIPLEDESSLIGEFLHILLTPDHGADMSVHPDYLLAAENGRTGEDCLKIYPLCPVGLLDRISKVTW